VGGVNVAVIGNFGNRIVFETSDVKILNFTAFEQSVSGRWATHNRIMKKPSSEFLGPELRTISMEILLSAMHGVRPRSTLEQIEDIVENGIAELLVIGGKTIGKNKWAITECSESWDVIMSKGELLQAKVSLNLQEFL